MHPNGGYLITDRLIGRTVGYIQYDWVLCDTYDIPQYLSSILTWRYQNRQCHDIPRCTVAVKKLTWDGASIASTDDTIKLVQTCDAKTNVINSLWSNECSMRIEQVTQSCTRYKFLIFLHIVVFAQQSLLHCPSLGGIVIKKGLTPHGQEPGLKF